jgi:hypothetical protein
MKNSNEQTLKEVIKELLEAYKLKEGLQVTNVLQAWDQIAGPYISKYTEKIYIKHKKLYLKLSSPALKQELSYSKTDLVHRLNDLAGEEIVTDIVFL